MKWAIESVEQQNFIRIRLSEDYSVSEITQALEDLFSREFWKSGTPILFDDTNLNLTNTSLETIRQASEVHAKYASYYGDSKIAILADSLTDFARGRQFELLAGNKVHTNIRIFMEEDKAVNWLTD